MFSKLTKSILAISFVSISSLWAQTIQDGLKYMDMEQYANARKTFINLANANPQSAENQYYLGDFYVKIATIDTSADESLDSALVCFNKGIQIDPKYPMNYVGLGAANYLKGSWDNAALNFKKATEATKGKNAQVLYKIGEAYLYKGKKDVVVAIPQLERAAELDKKNTDIMLLLGDAYLLKDEGNGSRAAKQYNNALLLNPKLAKAHIKGGKIYLQARNFEEALKYFNKGIEADPSFSPAYRERAELYFKLKGYRDKAPAEYKTYLGMSDGNYKSKFRFAYFCFINGNYTDAMDMLNQLAKVNPNDKILFRLTGYSNYEAGAANKDTVAAKNNYKVGLENMTKFFAINTDTNKIIASDYEYYGKLLIKTGNEAKGTEYLEKVVKKDSARFDIYGDLAKMASEKKNYKKAGDYYSLYFAKKASGLNDKLNWGRMYYNAEEFVKADTIFNMILKEKPDELLGYKWRAYTNEALDKDKKGGNAIPFYEKFIDVAIAKDANKYKSDLIRAYTYLGTYYLNKKNVAKSTEYWKKVGALDANDGNYKMMKQNLKF